MQENQKWNAHKYIFLTNQKKNSKIALAKKRAGPFAALQWNFHLKIPNFDPGVTVSLFLKFSPKGDQPYHIWVTPMKLH